MTDLGSWCEHEHRATTCPFCAKERVLEELADAADTWLSIREDGCDSPDVADRELKAAVRRYRAWCEEHDE